MRESTSPEEVIGLTTVDHDNVVDPPLSRPMDQSPRSKASVVVHRQESTFLGPIPPPSLLAQYNEIIPDGANRIMAMAERQSAHREAMEAKVIEGNIRSQGRGNIFAFTIVLIALLGAFVLLDTGRNIAGLSTFACGAFSRNTE